jgi:REP element-mobilizing transposase RayT
MKYDSDLRHRRSIRRREYDYSLAGAYFVTICIRNRECLLGEICNNTAYLSSIGNIVKKSWLKIPGHFKDVRLDRFVIMPNHLHGIIIIQRKPSKDTDIISEVDSNSKRRALDLGQIVAYFKYQTTKIINKINKTPGSPLWQRNYYEHIIRDEEEMKKYCKYINENPKNWDTDKENPINVKVRGIRNI